MQRPLNCPIFRAKICASTLVNQSYPAKLLLFGEYTVLLGGQALALPYDQYQGCWVPDQASASQSSFDALAEYLVKINNYLHAKLNLRDFKDFIGAGAVFESDIPQGVGLGSSAALAASVYDLFGDHEVLDLSQKKSDLALIESFYHGKSSGFDALVSLVQKPILLQSEHELVALDRFPEQALNLYLLFTEYDRKTQKLVSWFEDSFLTERFQKTVRELTEANHMAIKRTIDGLPIMEIVKKISAIQYDSFPLLIAPSLKELWQKTLSDDNLAIKILGAGGGGCYLLFSKCEMAGHSLDGFRLKKIDLSD